MSEPPMECEKCGAEMQEKQSWTRKSIPLIGSTVEFTDATCPECGHGMRYKRKEGTEEWKRAAG